MELYYDALKLPSEKCIYKNDKSCICCWNDNKESQYFIASDPFPEH